MKEVCAIGESGGMRNSFNSGYLLGSGLKPEKITHAIGVSSGSVTLANFLAGQVSESHRLWVEEFTRPEVCSVLNPVTRRKPIADVDHLIDVACGGLNLEKVFEVVKSFVVETVEMMSGAPHFIEATAGNIRPLLKASCALPFAARPVELEKGKYFVDGGAHEQLPVKYAYERGHRKLLVFCNKPGNFVPEEYNALQRWLFFPKSKPAREMLKERNNRFLAAREFLRNPPQDASVFLVMPREVPCDLLERNPDNVKRSFEAGFNLGRLDSSYLHEWLES